MDAPLSSSKHGRLLDFTRRPWVAVVMWGARGAEDARLRREGKTRKRKR